MTVAIVMPGGPRIGRGDDGHHPRRRPGRRRRASLGEPRRAQTALGAKRPARRYAVSRDGSRSTARVSDDPMVPFAPAIVAFFLYFFVYLLTGVSFLRERTGGTLERLMATPVTRGEVVGGYTLGLRAVRDGSGRGAARVGAGVAAGAVDRAAAGVLDRPRDPRRGQPAARVPRGRAAGARGRSASGSSCRRSPGPSSRSSSSSRSCWRPQFLLSGVLFPVVEPARRSSSPSSHHAAPLRGRGAAQVFIQGADLTSSALQVDVVVLAVIAVLFAVVASLTIRRDVV